MFDPERPWRRLASHPVEMVRALNDECRRGLITAAERDALVARIQANVDGFNASAKVINGAVKYHEGILPADQTGDKVHGLCDGLAIRAADQAAVVEGVKGAVLDWRGIRGARAFVRWDEEDRRNQNAFSGGHCDEAEEPWGEPDTSDEEEEEDGTA